MNKYLRAMCCVPYGMFRMFLLKLSHGKAFKGPRLSMISPFTEITLERGGKLTIGSNFKMRDGAKIRVRRGASCEIGDNSFISSNTTITCRDNIIIGNDVQLSPNVFIYDHDHDYKVPGGVKSEKYKSSPVKIGNNVWIGANTVILRGTVIGDSCVVGAGCVLKGIYPDGSLIVQKRDTEIYEYR